MDKFDAKYLDDILTILSNEPSNMLTKKELRQKLGDTYLTDEEKKLGLKWGAETGNDILSEKLNYLYSEGFIEIPNEGKVSNTNFYQYLINHKGKQKRFVKEMQQKQIKNKFYETSIQSQASFVNQKEQELELRIQSAKSQQKALLIKEEAVKLQKDALDLKNEAIRIQKEVLWGRRLANVIAGLALITSLYAIYQSNKITNIKNDRIENLEKLHHNLLKNKTSVNDI